MVSQEKGMLIGGVSGFVLFGVIGALIGNQFGYPDIGVLAAMVGGGAGGAAGGFLSHKRQK